MLQEVTHYLVKWCSLPYEESTWELEEDVDPGKIKEFEALQIPPEIKHMVTYPEVTYPAGSSLPWAQGLAVSYHSPAVLILSLVLQCKPCILPSGWVICQGLRLGCRGQDLVVTQLSVTALKCCPDVQPQQRDLASLGISISHGRCSCCPLLGAPSIRVLAETGEVPGVQEQQPAAGVSAGGNELAAL